MQEAQQHPTTKPAQALLARWRESWLLRHVPEPCNEDWGMECALPWLQSQAPTDQQP